MPLARREGKQAKTLVMHCSRQEVRLTAMVLAPHVRARLFPEVAITSHWQLYACVDCTERDGKRSVMLDGAGKVMRYKFGNYATITTPQPLQAPCLPSSEHATHVEEGDKENRPAFAKVDDYGRISLQVVPKISRPSSCTGHGPHTPGSNCGNKRVVVFRRSAFSPVKQQPSPPP